MSESGLVQAYQQNQSGPTCTSYAISTALNILYGTNTTGQGVLDTFTHASIFPSHWPRLSWRINGGAVLPNQGKRIVNIFGGEILGQSDDLPTAETTNLTFEEMIEIIEDPNRVALFTYNTINSGWFWPRWKSGHTITLAAYDPESNSFGFLNSGAGAKPKLLTWYTQSELEAFIEDPIGLWSPNFLVISRPPQSSGYGGLNDDVKIK